MSADEETYCRLCADPTPKFQLIYPEEDVAISSKVATKLLWINIDIASSPLLPNSICFACFDSLERTWSFLHNVRAAQKKLSDIFTAKVPVENSKALKVLDNPDAGKPVNKDWETFQELKTEVKIESIETNDVTVDTNQEQLLKNNFDIKEEYQSDNDILDVIDNECLNGYNSTDSDLPLGVSLRQKKVKRRRKTKHKTGKHRDSIDISSINTTWENFVCGCGRCDAQCKSIAALQLHSLQIHDQCCIFKCLDCGKKFLTFKPFISHSRMHVKDLQYCCEYCNNLFTCLSYLKRHRNKEHNCVFVTKCRNCGTSFETAEQLQDHRSAYGTEVKRAKENKESILKCEFCDKKFKSKSNLQQHKLVHTERSRDFSCHVCGKMFFTKGTLGAHMMTHEETKPFKCEFCPLAFRARGNLQSHLSLHSGTKPFVCEQCGKSFRVKRHLKSHSIVHTDLMPFSCQYCNKTFRFKTRLNLHLRQHTGAKPYRCVFCQRDFTNGSNFKKHMKRRHAIDTSRQKFGNVSGDVKNCGVTIVGAEGQVLTSQMN